ncbi:hypothetical protein PUNSTDRAFT_135859 [Punctularia strigosozonata HHB-11173 SS5]|uniref:uncharacterized protein n=1 Tax=Punctularia strigosozonata (strain HHB-11173) TaxID=741275 RepID=UPI0004417A00|nr:uncharacterized protein PUNSTDRAFT_135859 [Punctularia strigosozonata HHB-11173 SS5]EIN07176.1 hypothetical protein PUNSTDRAFT_135859 [Punctularia strigosozonata HHB-11173 SS5]
MAQTLRPGGHDSQRISQLLPGVKCSQCGTSVPLDQLPDHVCAPVPPVPKLPLPPPSKGGADPISLLPARLQGLLRSPSPGTQQQKQQQQQQQRAASPSPSKTPTPRSRAPSNASINQPPRIQDPAIRRTPSPLARGPEPPRTASSPYPRDQPSRGPSEAAPRPPPSPYARDQPSRGPVDRSGTPSNSSYVVRDPPPRSGSTTPAAAYQPHANRTQAPYQTTNPAPSVQNGRPPASPLPPPMINYRPPPSPQTQPPDEYRSGGEAGMAGVGRRAFQAAARAAMWAQGQAQPPEAPTQQQQYSYPDQSQARAGPSGYQGYNAPYDERMKMSAPAAGMDGRRPNAPPHLAIDNRPSAATPPLSPESGSVSSYSAGTSARSPTGTTSTAPTTILSARTPSPTRSTRRVEAPATPEPSTPRLPFFEKFKNKLPANVSIPTPTVDRFNAANKENDDDDKDRSKGALSPRSPDSASDYSSSAGFGLAYRDGDTDSAAGSAYAMSPPTRSAPLPLNPDKRSRAGSSSTTNSSTQKIQFPSTSDSPPRAGASARMSATTPTTPGRSISSASAYSGRTAGALNRASRNPMDVLSEEEDGAGPVAGVGTGAGGLKGSASVHGAGKKEREREAALRPPMRANTSPTTERELDSERKSVRRRVKERKCVRCERVITDGRWVAMDEGGVLCERCWKNMYLPKCRRCNLPIEKAAVSSSDGQLKGKYHRECFNCHTCHKPFPDKTFYVFDGKPFCAYHYHEANDSLCAAATCGQPIEGPCALSHTGDRYHPEHLTCEYEYPNDPYAGTPKARRCPVRLEDYFEMDGRMLCEKHARAMEDAAREEEEGEDRAWGEDRDRERRAMKRTTRFIDLANGGMGLGGSGLR